MPPDHAGTWSKWCRGAKLPPLEMCPTSDSFSRSRSEASGDSGTTWLWRGFIVSEKVKSNTLAEWRDQARHKAPLPNSRVYKITQCLKLFVSLWKCSGRFRKGLRRPWLVLEFVSYTVFVQAKQTDSLHFPWQPGISIAMWELQSCMQVACKSWSKVCRFSLRLFPCRIYNFNRNWHTLGALWHHFPLS